MSSDTILTDDYVAGLLAKEAGDASIKYSSVGLEAFRSGKPANKAKPNTRFLGRIIKETTSHNAALLAKEAADAQARLDSLTGGQRKRQKQDPSAGDIRKRQLGDISSILLGGKPKRSGEGSKGHKEKQPSTADTKRRDDRRGKKHEEQRRDQQSDRHTREGRRDRDRSRSPASGPRRYRHRSPLSGDDDSGDDRRRKSYKRERPEVRRDIRADLFDGSLPKYKSHGRLLDEEEDTAASTSENNDLFSGSLAAKDRHGRLRMDDDSDPLEDLIGPSPPRQSPVRRRGRGAGRSSAAMDARFSDTYDPQSDVLPEEDDWDMAVEEFRDRQKWKQQGAERLRAAGFTEEEIKKWEKGGERDHNDVRWAKVGESREWDKGKAV